MSVSVCCVSIFVGVMSVCAFACGLSIWNPSGASCIFKSLVKQWKFRVLSYLTFSGFISISVARNSRANSHRGQTAIIKFPKVNGLTWHSESLTYLIPCIFTDCISLSLSLHCCWGARSRRRVTALDRHPEIKTNGSDGGNMVCHLCGSGFCALSWNQVQPHGSFFLSWINPHRTSGPNTTYSYMLWFIIWQA